MQKRTPKDQARASPRSQLGEDRWQGGFVAVGAEMTSCVPFRRKKKVAALWARPIRCNGQISQSIMKQCPKCSQISSENSCLCSCGHESKKRITLGLAVCRCLLWATLTAFSVGFSFSFIRIPRETDPFACMSLAIIGSSEWLFFHLLPILSASTVYYFCVKSGCGLFKALYLALLVIVIYSMLIPASVVNI